MNEELLAYLEKANSMTSFKAAIVGQDPYPSNPSGIPFCKRTFNELFERTENSRCCGQDVLFSLGFREEVVRRRFEKPTDVFYDLLEKGMVVLNISYELLDAPYVKDQTTEDFRKKMFAVNKDKIDQAHTYNQPILEKAEKIFLLGDFRTAPIFENYYAGLSATEVLIHPSGNNLKGNTKEKWKATWETTYLLNKIKSH